MLKLLESNEAKSAFLYAGASLCTHLIAKVVVNRLFFDYPIVILMLQHAAALLLIEVARVTSLIKLTPYSLDRGRHLFLPSVLLSVSSWLSVASLEGIGMPVFDSVKRMTAIFVLVGGGFVLKRNWSEQKNALSIVVISLATALTVNFDLNMDRFSLFYGLIAAITQAIAYLQLEVLSATFPPIELLYMHSFNSLVVFLLADVIQDEVRDAFMYMMTSANGLFTCLLLILLISGLFLNFTMMHCISTNGALTTAITSNIRAAIQIMIAYYSWVHLFYDVMPTFIHWIGLFLALGFAVVLYRKPRNGYSNEKTYTNLA
ncbi:unnamed protein product, partial [Mesorhabditis belari]|uniref:Sugar phosphate transporter domain-containing protein n=1 Tax=Mesorhabditis belari TaxID=2138241 RepID=A0AAF3JAB9_9BILA